MLLPAKVIKKPSGLNEKSLGLIFFTVDFRLNNIWNANIGK